MVTNVIQGMFCQSCYGLCAFELFLDFLPGVNQIPVLAQRSMDQILVFGREQGDLSGARDFNQLGQEPVLQWLSPSDF